MEYNNRIVKAVYSAVDDLNEQRAEDEALKKSPDTALFGPTGSIDSLGLVNLIVALEERVNEEFGLRISLADERAVSQKKSPFETIASLVSYIQTLLDEKK